MYTDWSSLPADLRDQAATNRLDTQLRARTGQSFPRMSMAALRDAAVAELLATTAYTVNVTAHGAVGDGTADDTAAISAAYADAVANGGIVFFPSGTYRVSGTIAPGALCRSLFDDCTIIAATTGTFDAVLDNVGADTGYTVLFDLLNMSGSQFMGKLTMDGNSVASLVGFSSSDVAGAGAGQSIWDRLTLQNFAIGLYAPGDGTLFTGSLFQVVQGYTNGYDIYATGNTFDDVTISILRSQSSPDAADQNLANVYLDSVFGVSGSSWYIRGQDSTRTGINILAGASLALNHLYVEADFDVPVSLGLRSALHCQDVKVSTTTTSTGGEVFRMAATAGLLDVTINRRVTGADSITSLVTLETAASSSAQRIVLLKLPFTIASKAPIAYDGTGASDSDIVHVYARGGLYKYRYDGTTLTYVQDEEHGTVGISISANADVSVDQNGDGDVSHHRILRITNTAGSGKTATLLQPPAEALGRIVTLQAVTDNVSVLDDGLGTSYFRSATTTSRLLNAARQSVLTVQCVLDGSTRVWNELAYWDDGPVASFTDQDATPSVAAYKRGASIFKTANTMATTITALADGVEGQEVVVFINDAVTTIDFTGTTLTGNGGMDWSPSSGDMMRCVFDGTNWRCQVTECS